MFSWECLLPWKMECIVVKKFWSIEASREGNKILWREKNLNISKMTRWETKSICFNDIIYNFVALDININNYLKIENTLAFFAKFMSILLCTKVLQLQLTWHFHFWESLHPQFSGNHNNTLILSPAIRDPGSGQAGWHGADMCWLLRSWWGVNITHTEV